MVNKAISLRSYVEEIYKQIGTEEKYFISQPVTEFIKNYNFNKLIEDENTCVNFIKLVLDEDEILNSKLDDIEKKNDDDVIFSTNKERASHIIITWLLGVGLSNIFKLNNYKFVNFSANRIWLMAAIVHDYGYFCKEITNTPLSIDKLEGKYSLLTDQYTDPYFSALNNMSTSGFSCFFAYSYDEIKKYYEYSIWYHQNVSKRDENDLVENCDHGIVGGCLEFNRYCKRSKRLNDALAKNYYEKRKADIEQVADSATKTEQLMQLETEYKSGSLEKYWYEILKQEIEQKSDVETKNELLAKLEANYNNGTLYSGSYLAHQIQKIACITAASHNIFKSTKSENDKNYIEFGLNNLLSSSSIRVDQDKPLLALLSLVDTIECTKRFSRKANKASYLRNTTILDNVMIKTTNSFVIIDYELLWKKVKGRKNEAITRNFNSLINGVKTINTWTCFKATSIDSNNEFLFKIKI